MIWLWNPLLSSAITTSFTAMPSPPAKSLATAAHRGELSNLLSVVASFCLIWPGLPPAQAQESQFDLSTSNLSIQLSNISTQLNNLNDNVKKVAERVSKLEEGIGGIKQSQEDIKEGIKDNRDDMVKLRESVAGAEALLVWGQRLFIALLSGGLSAGVAVWVSCRAGSRSPKESGVVLQQRTDGDPEGIQGLPTVVAGQARPHQG